jgi:hypothetical protein
MSIEAGVLVDLDCEPIYWHLPENRSGGSLPDSRPLWDVIWKNRENLLGFAHSHPGRGLPGPSHEDVTTFAAIEAALGERLIWWIVSEDSWTEFCWIGPGRLGYRMGPNVWQPPWVERLRVESGYQIKSEGKVLYGSE